ncbi:MAG TPA: 16S rRNA (guanine(966)-N(2))-methyltransferase RsmD [Nitrospirales bacterium]|nr:16S rRNA (guanine(966)-N(2))-methyltransferase RsmD [Nitrospiraceae bacterium]HNP29552.1 16S rRNA (guanine(966)-N(2))-methyltransferase RsmD [Nitrospirales bacterium]
MKPASIRIVAGQFKGRTIPTLPGRTTRPTSQRAREALFSILGGRIQDATVADLFAGTGAVGLEALSRGASRVLFVEENALAGNNIQRMLSHLKIASSSQVSIDDVSLAIQNSILVGWRPFDVIFMDPPYRFPNVQQLLHHLEEADVMAPTGRIIYEHFHKTTPPIPLGKWSLIRTARYGDTAFTFYRPVPQMTEDSGP